MKAARDKQLNFCSSICSKGYYLYLAVQSHVVAVHTVCKFAASKHWSETNEKTLQTIL